MTLYFGQTMVRLRAVSSGCSIRFDLGMIPDGVIPDSGVVRGVDVRFVNEKTPSGPEDWAIVSWLREDES